MDENTKCVEKCVFSALAYGFYPFIIQMVKQEQIKNLYAKNKQPQSL